MVLSMPQRAVLVTAPISKEAIHLAGVDFPGHTELLATWCGLDPNSDVRMMLAIPSLRVILHSIHIPLVAVPASVEPVSLHRTFQITAGWCLSQGNPGAKVAVCGLNPHAGENGYLGREELDILSPAIDRANETLGPVTFHGPFPGDTIFARALVGEFDVVVAMYHDQGLVAVKTLDMHRGVNHTLGLPYVRTSPDHGTAFGLAGRGMALEGSMLAAVEMASDYLARRCSRTGTSREAPEGPRHD
jgi:4-hydroxythreonine-4-phosphate dehydrogenase